MIPTMNSEIDVSNVQLKIEDYSNTLLEMGDYDIKFLINALRRYKPKNILEIGVSAGGSSYYFLREMRKNSKLTSVDISKTYYKDNTKEVGFVVSELLGEYDQDKWLRLFGEDIIYNIDTIQKRGPFDFIFIDTEHIMPGEFLSFLAVLPFVKRGSPIVFHDIMLSYHQAISWNEDIFCKWQSFCTGLLFSCASSKKKERPMTHCNIGMLIYDKMTEENVLDVIHAMYMPWAYLPSKEMLSLYSQFIKDHYNHSCSRYFNDLITYEEKYFSEK